MKNIIGQIMINVITHLFAKFISYQDLYHEVIFAYGKNIIR